MANPLSFARSMLLKLYFAQSMSKPVFCSVYAEACILLSLCWSLYFFFFSPISLGTKFLGWVNFLQKLLSIVCYYKHSNPDQWLLKQFLNPYAVFISSRNVRGWGDVSHATSCIVEWHYCVAADGLILPHLCHGLCTHVYKSWLDFSTYTWCAS